MVRVSKALCLQIMLRDGASRLWLAAFAMTFLLSIDAAFAQTPAPLAGGDAAKAVAGSWEMSNAERDRSCVLTLRGGVGSAASTVAWDAKCPEAFPFSRNVVSWSVGARESIVLLDAGGRTVIELSEVEGGLYEGERPGEGLVFLQSSAGGAAERKPEEFAGEWVFMRPAGKPLCRVTLTTTPAAQDAFTLAVRPGCDALVARFRPVAWRYDRGQLVVIPAQGDVWRFEEGEPNTWSRIPESRQPLRLVKQ